MNPYIQTLMNMHFMPLFLQTGRKSSREEVMAAKPFPDSLAQQLIAASRNLAASFEEDGAVGGHGFTRKTAWRVMLKDSSAVSLEYMIVRICFGTQPETQSLSKVWGRYYDTLSFLATAEGKTYRVEQWFDITPYYKHTYGRG